MVFCGVVVVIFWVGVVWSYYFVFIYIFGGFGVFCFGSVVVGVFEGGSFFFIY